MSDVPETIKCRCCNGSGRVPNPAKIGESYRNRRELNGHSLRTVAKRAGISAMYLSDLERGRRNWNPELERKIKSAIQ